MFAIYPGTAFSHDAHYSYGVAITEKFGQLLYFHGGGISGFATAIQRYPKSNICVVVLSNDEDVKSLDIATILAGLLLDK
jgi:Beta-lactamase